MEVRVLEARTYRIEVTDFFRLIFMANSEQKRSPDRKQANTEASTQDREEDAGASNIIPSSDYPAEFNRRFRNSRLLALAIAIINLLVLAVGGFISDLLYWSLCSVGIISFIGILTLVN